MIRLVHSLGVTSSAFPMSVRAPTSITGVMDISMMSAFYLTASETNFAAKPVSNVVPMHINASMSVSSDFSVSERQCCSEYDSSK